MPLTTDDLRPVDVPAVVVVSGEQGRAVTVTFSVTDGGGSVSISMSPSRAIRLAEELVQAAAGGLDWRRALHDLAS